MVEHVVGRLERVGEDGELLVDEIEMEIDRLRVTFPFTTDLAWRGDRHRLTTDGGRIVEFVVERHRPYPSDPNGDEILVEGRVVADYRDA